MVHACGQLTGLADQIRMGWFSRETEAGMARLTHEERKLFDRLDQAVGMATRAAKVVIDGGHALGVIRDQQLYRETAATWEEYLAKHGLTRRRADQLVSAAKTLDAVSEALRSKTGTVVPNLDGVTERTARQLVGMDTSEAADAVIEAASSPAGITASSIKKAVAKRKAKVAKVARPRRFRVPGAAVVVTFNRKSDGSVFNALKAALQQLEAEIETQAEAA